MSVVERPIARPFILIYYNSLNFSVSAWHVGLVIRAAVRYLGLCAVLPCLLDLVSDIPPLQRRETSG